MREPRYTVHRSWSSKIRCTCHKHLYVPRASGSARHLLEEHCILPLQLSVTSHVTREVTAVSLSVITCNMNRPRSWPETRGASGPEGPAHVHRRLPAGQTHSHCSHYVKVRQQTCVPFQGVGTPRIFACVSASAPSMQGSTSHLLPFPEAPVIVSHPC